MHLGKLLVMGCVKIIHFLDGLLPIADGPCISITVWDYKPLKNTRL